MTRPDGPPHYRRSPKGEVWRLEEHLAELVDLAGQLADPVMVVLSTYAVGYSRWPSSICSGDLDGGSVEAEAGDPRGSRRGAGA